MRAVIFKEHLVLRKREFGRTVVVLAGKAFFASHLGSPIAGPLPPWGPSPLWEVEFLEPEPRQAEGFPNSSEGGSSGRA